jgi:hypothetical protein
MAPKKRVSKSKGLSIQADEDDVFDSDADDIVVPPESLPAMEVVEEDGS